MKLPRRQRLQLAAGAVTFLILSVGLPVHDAWSQATRTIRVVVPFPPGGTMDVLARVLTEQIGRAQGQSMVVENRPGGGSAIGTETAARAAPDGNTVLMLANSFVINPHLKKLNYDPLTSFEPICYLVRTPNVFAVNTSSPHRTIGDLLSAARMKPGDLTLASVGPATTQHIAIEVFKRAANVSMTYVPFPGDAPAVNALLGEHVASVLATNTAVSGHVAGGQASGPRRRFEKPDRIAARPADGRRIRFQGLRGGRLVRAGCAGQYAKGYGVPACQLVQRRNASARGQGEACGPGAPSGRDMRRGFRRASSKAIRRIRPRHSGGEYQGGVTRPATD